MKQLHPRSVWLFFIAGLVHALFFILIFGISLFMILLELRGMGGLFIFLGLFVTSSIFIFVICYIWARLSYHYYRYELTEDGFKKELGVIYKKYVTIPYERIQNVDIYRGIVSRLLGLSDLNIQTAGASAQVTRYGVSGAGAEGRLPGLLHEDAEKLREELIKRAKNPGSGGL